MKVIIEFKIQENLVNKHLNIKIQNQFDVTWIRFSCRVDQRCLHPLQACFQFSFVRQRIWTTISYLQVSQARMPSLPLFFFILFGEAVKVVVRKQKMKTENRKQRIRRFNGSLESRTVRGRERECVREKNRKFYSKTLQSTIIFSTIYVCVCSMHTYIQVLTRTDRSTIVLQCS